MKKRMAIAALLTVGLMTGAMTAGALFGQTQSDYPMTAASLAVSAAAGHSWGLSFQQDGQPPVGNAAAEYLRQFDAWYVDESAGGGVGTGGAAAKDPDTAKAPEKPIYLTFDAGYENGYTAEILDVLAAENVPAAFFLVGHYIEEEPALVKRMVEEGHVVGNHTMHHPDMAAIAKKEDFAEELSALEKTFQQATGREMEKFYRPPQGLYSEENLMQAHELGYKTIFWSLAYVDWYENDQPSREEALNTLNKRIHPGAIVLLHSTSKTNCQILQELIRGWKEKGYTFCSLRDLT